MQTVANLSNFLVLAARQFPDRPAIIHGDLSQSWAQTRARVGALAAGLRDELGIEPGDRVVVHLPNGAPLLESMWAVWSIGAIWVPSNIRSMPKDLAWIFESTGARGLICDAEARDHVGIEADTLETRLVSGGQNDPYEALLARHTGADLRPMVMQYGDPAWFFMTSGTTSKPKAAILTHGQMAYIVTNHIADLMPGLSERDVSLAVAPLSHGAGTHYLIQSARGGATVIPEGRSFDAAEAWALVERYGVTNMFTVPTILKMLVEHPDVASRDHSSLRHVIYAGAPMFAVDQRRALLALGPVLVQYYGLGEVTGCITGLHPDLHGDPDRTGSCGVARTGMQIDIQDPEGRSLPSGEIGEICTIGPGVCAGYWNNEQATAKSFRDGWFLTGDMGYLDANGFLYLTGRASEMYISGGSNLSPREIEEELLEHDAVQEVCVFGVPDDKWGEIGVAIAVTDADADLSGESLRAFLKSRLTGYKVPARIEIREALPKSPNGKIVRKDVRAEWIASQPANTGDRT
ncbi:AMP-binding protein [Roseovarius gahaiensis]|uniref:AMP-binding protein n=1 Tax=Roseovarius gahaiensis TaxID=2716691 RepID=A0A967BDV2_9RHOB|nr:AMP-binding protein [Roseovarius gahaiensis]NHQ75309.1 AMP-binding protein [Roseovarius gahaiensis]